MQQDQDPFGEQKLTRLGLMLYFFPVVGSFPALWTLSRAQATGEQKRLSRRALTVTGIWLLLYGLLSTGASYGSESLSLRLLYTNGLLTTGYIVVCLALMLGIWQGKHRR